MFDFSSQINSNHIDTTGLATAEDAIFTGNIHTGDINVDMTAIGTYLSDDIIVPFEKDDKRFELVFTGTRADLYQQTVLAHLAGMCAASDTDNARIDLNVKGTWTRRTWKTRQGKEMSTLRLNVAQWSWDEGKGLRTAGHIPA
jgi:hypothetical protein